MTCASVQTTCQHASDAPNESDDGINAEGSQSEDNSPEYNSQQGQRLGDIKDWVALDFNIIRNAALRKVCMLFHLLQHWPHA